MIRSFATVTLLLATIAAHGANRSSATRSEFVRMNPCPLNGRTKGPCPGWEVDHIEPLKCGGPDRPENMQWLTVEQHKKKTAAEAKRCRSRH